MEHNEFMKKVEEASSLPARTKEALGPVTKEDFAILGADE